MVIDAKVIGKRLKELRGGKTINEEAKSIGISPSAFSMYENGERIPRDEIKVKLAKKYNRSVESIFFAEN